MHGTVEWLPGQPLGNDRQSWSDELLGSLPNVYVYAANNPSESILAKRRGYGTLVSYNVPPYGRAGLYLELANLKDLVNEYRTTSTGDQDLRSAIWNSCQRCGIESDVPLYITMDSTQVLISDPDLPPTLTEGEFNGWLVNLAEYLVELQDRLFSSGLHTLGSAPTDDEMLSYLQAYFGDALSEDDFREAIEAHKTAIVHDTDIWTDIKEFVQKYFGPMLGFESHSIEDTSSISENRIDEAKNIVSLLSKNTEELDGVLSALDGGFVKPAPGGDLLRDGTAVLPTGRNIHALDPYRMPSAGAWARGQRIAEETIRQHLEANDNQYPETIAVTLWGKLLLS
jgi:magnesium chelatase subunit H